MVYYRYCFSCDCFDYLYYSLCNRYSSIIELLVLILYRQFPPQGLPMQKTVISIPQPISYMSKKLLAGVMLFQIILFPRIKQHLLKEIHMRIKRAIQNGNAILTIQTKTILSYINLIPITIAQEFSAIINLMSQHLAQITTTAITLVSQPATLMVL